LSCSNASSSLLNKAFTLFSAQYTSSYNAYLCCTFSAIMTIHSESRNGVLILRPDQPVDYLAAEELRERLAIAISDRAVPLILDLSLARYASASSLQVVCNAARQFRTNRSPIAIAGACAQFRDLLHVSGAAQLLPAFDTVEEAEAHFREHAHDRHTRSAADNKGPDSINR
jgi:anti-anti-sigma factor